ncbi:putative ribonuclease H-like domain-containing protein [Tanacetum coccineum]
MVENKKISLLLKKKRIKAYTFLFFEERGLQIDQGLGTTSGIKAFLRNFDLEVMEFESAHSNTTTMLPILKLAQENGTSVTKMSILVTVKEKTNKKNDMKARSLLLVALPNEHQLTFSQYTDAKTMFIAIETQFGAKPAYEVSTVSSNVNIASPQVSIASFSDNVIYAFMVENPNGSNLLKQNLEQIHEDDLEAIDLKVAALLLRIESKEGHFARECRAPRDNEGLVGKSDNSRKKGIHEDTSSQRQKLAHRWLIAKCSIKGKGLEQSLMNMQDNYDSDSSPKEVNTAGQHVNTASPEVWILMDFPIGKRALGTKWVFKNKKEERGIVIRNKARLVAQGHRQREKVLDYEEVFASRQGIEAIRLFLAYASFMGFLVYQMDVKSAFSYGTIEEKVYVTQPPGFKDPDHPNNVYKVVKALYGFHQAPRAWYETLANYLLGNGFKRGKIDQILFIKKQKGDILLIQMSSMGELTLFLGLQVQQKEDGIFISHDRYVAEILKEKELNYTIYDWVFGCQKSYNIKTIYYVLQYVNVLDFKFTPMDITSLVLLFTDSDYARATQDRKSTTGGCQFLGNRLISWQCKKQTMVAPLTIEDDMWLVASCSWKGTLDSNYCGIIDLLTKEFCDKHNMVAYLEKSEGSEGFYEIIDFLSASHIHYALTASPTIYTSLIEQFWQTAALCTIDDGVLGITATIDRKNRNLEQLALMGYVTTSDSLTFQKGYFSP